MEGKWFHTFDARGDVHWQGQILRDLGDGSYEVQLYSWVLGEPTNRDVLLPVVRRVYYDTDAEMRAAYEGRG